MRLSRCRIAWQSAALVGVCAIAVAAWWLRTKPVLFHSHLFATAEDRSCGDYNVSGTGVPVLNPLRSRYPERIAEAFLQAALSGKCLPEWKAGTCEFLRMHRPAQARAWRLVDRCESPADILLYYRLELMERAEPKHCFSAHVHLQRVGTTWEIAGFGFGGHNLCPG